MVGIYKITNNINNKCYIGQSGGLERRWSAHKNAAFQKDCHHDNELYEDIRKYGVENFSFEILEIVSLDELEEKWIQIEKEKHEVYNKVLYPRTDPCSYMRRFNENELDEIIQELKKNKLSNIKISEMFNCSSTTIDGINNGTRYRKENIDYPIRQYDKSGEHNPNSIYSNEEVFKIRKEYVTKTMKELFTLYGKNSSYDAFEGIVNGKTYKNVPIYKKRQRIWEKDGMPYRLEP